MFKKLTKIWNEVWTVKSVDVHEWTIDVDVLFVF